MKKNKIHKVMSLLFVIGASQAAPQITKEPYKPPHSAKPYVFTDRMQLPTGIPEHRLLPRPGEEVLVSRPGLKDTCVGCFYCAEVLPSERLEGLMPDFSKRLKLVAEKGWPMGYKKTDTGAIYAYYPVSAQLTRAHATGLVGETMCISLREMPTADFGLVVCLSYDSKTGTMDISAQSKFLHPFQQLHTLYGYLHALQIRSALNSTLPKGAVDIICSFLPYSDSFGVVLKTAYHEYCCEGTNLKGLRIESRQKDTEINKKAAMLFASIPDNLSPLMEEATNFLRNKLIRDHRTSLREIWLLLLEELLKGVRPEEIRTKLANVTDARTRKTLDAIAREACQGKSPLLKGIFDFSVRHF